jgi:hypothetical protein
MAEEPANPAPASAEAIELAESRRGVFFQAEAGLPDGFVLPSAALIPPQAQAQAQAATATDTSAATAQAAPRER